MFSGSRKLVIILFIIAGAIACLIGTVWWGMKLYEARGYSFLMPRPDAPYGRARRRLWQINEFYEKNAEKFDWKWPDAKTLVANIPELILVKNQPYEEFDIYVLKSERIKQAFLYSPNSFVATSKLARMKNRFRLSTEGEREVFQAGGARFVVVCVMAARKNLDGIYCPYNEYPLALKKTIGLEAWKTWYFIMEDDGLALTYYIQSDLPPIPGCLAYIDQMESKLSKFYYPKEIIPAFKAIYPDADIPEEQILPEGRDY